MRNKQSEKTKKIAVAGVLLALILIFLLVPINLSGLVDIAVVALIAVLIACQFDGLWMGLFCGVAFGVTSLIASYTTGAGALLAPAFQNPLISIFPRLIIPITTYFSYIGMRKLFLLIYGAKKKEFDENKANHLSVYVSSLVSSIVGVLTNTALVMGMLFAFHAGDMFGETEIGLPLLITILSVNFPIELAICAVVTPSILIGIRLALQITTDPYRIKRTSLTTQPNE